MTSPTATPPQGGHQQQEPAASPDPAGSIKLRAIKSSFWTLVSYGGSRGLSFVSNLILASLLYREAFGVMMLITTIVTGIHLFSDIGTGPSIIHSRRGTDPVFLNTAWTLQIVRGIGVFLVTCVLAWPVSVLYNNQDLLLMTPAAGINAVIGGFTSTRLFTANRSLQLKRLAVLDLGAQLVTIPVTATLAWWLHSPWALLCGWSVGETVRMALSHLALPGHRNRLMFDKRALGELVHFGRWIFVSTALTFFSLRSDTLVLGRLFTDAERGVYWIAQTIGLVIPDTFAALAQRVIFPTLSEIGRNDPSRIGSALTRFRMHTVPCACLGLCVLAVFGQVIVGWLYKPEYASAGWILRILAAGYIMRLIIISSNCVWLALGDSFRMMTMVAVPIPILLTSMFIGHHFGGPVGTVLGVASTDLLCYPYVAWCLNRKKLWNPKLDLTVMTAAAVVVALGAWLV